MNTQTEKVELIKVLSEEPLATYWWNFWSKKNDFNGTIAEYFEEKQFKVKRITHKEHQDVNGLRFNFSLSSINNTIDVWSGSPADAALTAIKTFLTQLGDKAIIISRHRTIRINH